MWPGRHHEVEGFARHEAGVDEGFVPLGACREFAKVCKSDLVLKSLRGMFTVTLTIIIQWLYHH